MQGTLFDIVFLCPFASPDVCLMGQRASKSSDIGAGVMVLREHLVTVYPACDSFCIRRRSSGAK